MNTVERFAKLFRGRIDAYGSWEGGCVREPLTLEHYWQHLHGVEPESWIGVYPLGKEMCSWGCIDIDGGDFPKMEGCDNCGETDEHTCHLDGEEYGPYDVRNYSDYDRKDPKWHDWDAMYALAQDLVTVLAVKNVNGYIERTRNGYHVWVFPEEKLVKGATMRRALMAACTALDYKPNEVNPKSERLEGDQVGNYVRLPYNGAVTAPGGMNRIFVEGERGEYELGLDAFLDIVKTTTTQALEEIASLWSPPRKTYVVNAEAGLEAQPIVRKLDALGYTIWRDGPLPGSDRSSTLAHLAHLCRESNLSADEAFTVVRSADERHGRKFADREDGEQRIAEMIERAFAT